MTSLTFVPKVPKISEVFDPSQKWHRNRAEKVIHFLGGLLTKESEDGFIEIPDNEVLRPIFGHHKKDQANGLGHVLITRILKQISFTYSNFGENSFCYKYIIDRAELAELIEIFTEYKFRKLKKSDQKVVSNSLLSTVYLKELLKKHFPNLAEKILPTSPSLTSTSGVCSTDFTFFKNEDQERLEAIRATEASITYLKELQGKKSWEYNDKTYRLWHYLQGIRRELKADIFAAFIPNDYDISTCALATLYSSVRKLDKDFSEADYPLVKENIDNKRMVRAAIAARFGLTKDKAKDLFSYLNNNGALTSAYKRGLWKICEGDQVLAQSICDNAYIKAYRKEIKKLWTIWLRKHNMEVMFSADLKAHTSINGEIYFSGIPDEYTSNKDQFMLYFRKEREILEIMKSYMENKGGNLFLEHDGFRSSYELNPAEITELEDLIFSLTSIKVSIESNKTEEEKKNPNQSASILSSLSILGVCSTDFTVFDNSPAGKALRKKYEQIEQNRAIARAQLTELEMALL